MKKNQPGFTLIELMITVAIIGILAVVGVLNYNSSVRKASEGLTKGNLGTIRSAISIYYGDNDAFYPSDNLSTITSSARYLLNIPITRIIPYHPDRSQVTAETTPTETGGWSYNNSASNPAWGSVVVGCTHQDSRNQIWSTYYISCFLPWTLLNSSLQYGLN